MDSRGCSHQTHILSLVYFFFLFFFFTAFLCSFADPTLPPECIEPSHCGSISVEYPFWDKSKPDHCWGRPELELDCVSDGVLIMKTLSKERFQIISLNNTLRTLRMARFEFFDHGDCSTQRLSNMSSDGQHFLEIFRFREASVIFNLTLYYNCDPFVTQLPNWKYDYMNCTSMDGAQKPLISLTPYGCKKSFQNPIEDWLKKKINNWPLVDILRKGFRLTWDNLECRTCNTSKGECPHNPKQVICPLPGEEAIATSRKNKSKALLVGMSTASVVIGLLLIAAFFVMKRRKQLINDNSKEMEGGGTTDASSSSANHYHSRLGVRVFSFDELVEATHNFDATKELGNGGFGVVYHGKLRDGREVAVKRLYERSFKHVEQFMNEVEILTRLRHPNLVTLYGCTSWRCRELLLVYEYLPNGTVADHLHGPHSLTSPLPWPARLTIAFETACALSYLHASDIIHRDVKTNNILLDKDFHVKVADFGLSRLFPNDVSHVSTIPQGTPGYMDPVYYEIYELTEKSDVYSFGVVVAELVSGKRAVDTRRRRHVVNLANMVLEMIHAGDLRELVDPVVGFEDGGGVKKEVAAVADLAFRCLQADRELRPSMEEVIEGLKLIVKGDRSESVEGPAVKEEVGPWSPDSVVNSQWIVSNSSNSGS